MKVTVCWYVQALNDLAEIYLRTADRSAVVAASSEIDQLLTVDPSRKGIDSPVASLDDETFEILAERSESLPESLRRLRLGPLTVFFTAHELDGQAHVWMVQERDS